MSGYTPLPPALIELPMLPLRDVVVFPHMVIPLFVGRPKSIKALKTAMAAERRIMLVAQKTAAKDEPAVDDMFDVGCVSTILQMLKLPDGTVKVLVEGQQRALVKSIVDGESHFVAAVTPVDPASEQSDASSEIEALRRAVMQQFDQYVKLNKKIPPEILTSISSIDDPGRLADTIAAACDAECTPSFAFATAFKHGGKAQGKFSTIDARGTAGTKRIFNIGIQAYAGRQRGFVGLCFQALLGEIIKS